MAAYGALSSLLLTLDNILDHNQTVSLNRGRLESLRERANFLRQCLENSSKLDTVESLEAKIGVMASRAEDLIAGTMYDDRSRDREIWMSPIWFCLATILCIFLCILYRLVFPFIPGTFGKILIIFCALGIYLMLPKDLEDEVSMIILGICLALIFSLMCYCWSLVVYIKKLVNLMARTETADQILSKILEDIISIAVEVGSVNDADLKDALAPPTVALTSAHDLGKNVAVGIDGELKKIEEELEYGSSPLLKIVPIVGMSGIGKTTLATQVYNDQYIGQQFDLCAWATVSRENNFRYVVLELLKTIKPQTLQEESDDVELGDYLYKCLNGRRYLIVMDDVWNIGIWERVKKFLPHEGNGSRVLLTTQSSEVIRGANSYGPIHQMQFLDDHQSERLLHERVFGLEDCPKELRGLQHEIATSCKGLALALVVTGGLLSKIARTKENWRSFADRLKSASTKDDDECMEILALSYNHLPLHLKPCFLYMGMFPENYTVRVAKLIQLWAAEGFLHLDSCNSVEELAEKYLEDLVQRNLIEVSSWSSQGKIKRCKMHDVLWKLCLREAQREKFLSAINQKQDFLKTDVESYRKLSIHRNILKTSPDILDSSKNQCALTAHCLMCIGTNHASTKHANLQYKLLKVLDLLTLNFSTFPVQITELVSLRYLALTFRGQLPPEISRLQNLQTIVHRNKFPLEDPCLTETIWEMLNLLHLHVPPTRLSRPPNQSNPLALQILVDVINLNFGIRILDRIKSLRKLSVYYDVEQGTFEEWSKYKLRNLARLNQLEKLKFQVFDFATTSEYQYPWQLAFPMSLKKLTLSGCRIPWGWLKTVGALPNIQVLKLRRNACQGDEWNPIEGQFGELKTLELQQVDLVRWRADETRFPRLKFLTIKSCRLLEEIPQGICHILTLERIKIVNCHPHVMTSAKQVRKEQVGRMGSSDLKVSV